MKDFHQSCKKILNNIEILKILNYYDNRDKIIAQANSLVEFEKTITNLDKVDHIEFQHIKTCEEYLLNIDTVNNTPDKKFIFEIIKNDFYSIKADYLHKVILSTKDSINLYLREDINHTPLEIEHIDQFNPEDFEEILEKENNKNKAVALKYFKILVILFEDFKKTKDLIKK